MICISPTHVCVAGEIVWTRSRALKRKTVQKTMQSIHILCTTTDDHLCPKYTSTIEVHTLFFQAANAIIGSRQKTPDKSVQDGFFCADCNKVLYGHGRDNCLDNLQSSRVNGMYVRTHIACKGTLYEVSGRHVFDKNALTHEDYSLRGDVRKEFRSQFHDLRRQNTHVGGGVNAFHFEKNVVTG